MSKNIIRLLVVGIAFAPVLSALAGGPAPPPVDAEAIPAVGLLGLAGLAGATAAMGIRYLKSRKDD